jgi:hypothetical protein
MAWIVSVEPTAIGALYVAELTVGVVPLVV